MADGKLIFDTKVDTKGVEEGMTKVSTVAKGALTANVVTAAAKAMGNLGKAAIEVGKNFESSMSQVAATMGITNEEIEAGSKDFEMLKAKAKEMGATTKYTASEAAEGLNILAMAGLSAEEACASIGDVMALAGAGALTLEQSATYVTGAVKGFNDEMQNAGKYADIMAKGATMANTDVGSLGEALSRASASANAYNQSVDSTSVALLRLAEQNVTGAEAATALSRVMADLYTPTDKAADALKELGIATYDEQGNARDLNDVVDELNVALSGMSDQQKLAYESTIFTTFGMKGFQKMTVSTTDTVNKFKKGIAEAGGSAMQQFATQTNNLEGKLAILNSALEATGIAIYEVFEDEMKHSVDSATGAVDKLHASIENGALGDSLKRLAEAAGEFLDTAMELGVNALPHLIDGLTFIIEHVPMILGTLAGYKAALIAQEVATIAATVAQEGLNKAIQSNPVGLIASAVGIAVGAITQAVSEAKEAERELNSIADSTVQAADKVKTLSEEISGGLEELKNKESYIKGLAEDLKKLNSLDKLDESQKKRVADITQKLNAEYSDLNLQIDETTGKLKEECQGWEDLLEAKMQQAKYAAISDMLTKAMKEQAEAEFALYENEQKLADIRKQKSITGIAIDNRSRNMDLTALSQNIDEYNPEIITHYDGLVGKMHDLEVQEKALKDAGDELRAQMDGQSETTKYLQEYMGSLSDEERAAGEAAVAAAEGTEGLAESNEEATASSEELSEAITKERENLESLVESQVASFDRINEATAVSKAKVLENLQSNVEAMNNWAENMNLLAERGIDDGLLQHLAQMGPEGAKQVQEFVNMTGDELNQAGNLWRDAISAEAVTNGLVDGYMAAGIQASQAWIDGAWQAVPQAEGVSQAIVDNIRNSGGWEQLPLDIQTKLTESVSGDVMGAVGEAAGQNTADSLMQATENTVKPEAENMGKAVPESVEAGADSVDLTPTGDTKAQELAEGMNMGTSKHVVPAGNRMAETATNTVDKGINRATYVHFGERVGDGLAEGIRSKIDAVRAAAAALAEAAEGASRGQLGIQSPSKVFKEIGQYCVAGFNEGLNGDTLQTSLGQNIQASLEGLSAVDRTPQPVIIESHIHMDADAQRVFNMVRAENKRIYETTGQNQLVM